MEKFRWGIAHIIILAIVAVLTLIMYFVNKTAFVVSLTYGLSVYAVFCFFHLVYFIITKIGDRQKEDSY